MLDVLRARRPGHRDRDGADRRRRLRRRAGDPLPDGDARARAAAPTPCCWAPSAARKYDTLPRALRPGAGHPRASARRSACSPTCARRCCIRSSRRRRRSSPRSSPGLDLMIVRELTGDIYFGEPRGRRTQRRGRATKASTRCATASREIRRIARVGFETARKRGKQALLGRQGQRARHEHPVARGRDRDRRATIPTSR